MTKPTEKPAFLDAIEGGAPLPQRVCLPKSPDFQAHVFEARLLAQVQAIVDRSGRAEGFDAEVWLDHWLQQPLPALGGRRPAEFLNTAQGQELLVSLIERMQGGGFA